MDDDENIEKLSHEKIVDYIRNIKNEIDAA